MTKRVLLLLSIALTAPAGVAAQTGVEGRVGKLESEMRAVQRKVFPGGAGLQPEIVAAQGAPAAGGVPASSAVADLAGRVSSLEQQMASMTDQIEQNGYRTRQLQEAFDTYRRSTDARLKALATPTAAPAGGTMGDEAEAPARPAPRPALQRPDAGTRTIVDAAKPSGTAVAAIEKPASGDTPEDEYLYGYRLWTAKRYPEAEAQLKKMVAAYPKHRRASYAQNLLGRAYLDDGKPSLASMAFYDNYKKMPDGERAPDSLYYLAQALMQLKKPTDACKVYGELGDVYGGKIDAGMKANVEKGRTAAKCK